MNSRHQLEIWSAPIWLRRTYAATMLVESTLSSVGDGASSGIWFSLSRSTKYHTRPNLDVGIASPLRYNAAPLTSFWFLVPKSPRLSSVESTWEVESEIYGGNFSVCIGAG